MRFLTVWRGLCPLVRAAGIAVVLSIGAPSLAQADCRMDEPPAEPSHVLFKHLSAECTEEERLAQAVTGDEVLIALKDGRTVDLAGVIVVGDVAVDELPVVPVESLGTMPSLVQQTLQEEKVTLVRDIKGSLSLRDSTMRGTIRTRAKDSYVIMRGPVTATATTFEGVLDLSRTVFLESVDFSHAIFLREGFFIQGVFTQPARFEQTAFGIHSRFHRSQFADQVTFLRSGFNGLAEFLQVTFQKDASFSRTYFKMGTGFSGSRFAGMLDFSEALFEREAYFLFTIFEGDAFFRRSVFRGQADFSDAEFHGGEDFSKTHFVLEPRFYRTKLKGDVPSRSALQDPRYLYGIGASLALFTALFVWGLRKQAR